MEKIRFRFTGGITETNEMNFYEFGRFQYGAARFIFTIEKFRQSGKVLQKISTHIDADIRVKAAAEGSFIQEIIIVAAPLLAECMIQCSFGALFSYIWDRILPPSKAKDVAIAIAIQETRRAEERTEQERQRTEQERQRTTQMQIMADVANNNSATTQQALDVLKYALDGDRSYIIDGSAYEEGDLNRLLLELKAEKERKAYIAQNSAALSQIDEATEAKIASQVRNSFKDIARPLKKSAEDMEIYGEAQNRERMIASIDIETAKRISSEVEDSNLTSVRGSIKSFDRETYNGKLRYAELEKPINFRIKAENRPDLYSKVLEAMGEAVEDVWLFMYLVRDAYGVPTRATLYNVMTDEEYRLLGE